MAERTEERLEWGEELSTGVETVDEQHRALFVCVAELEKATGERTMLATVHALAQLAHYAHEHFAEEERLMRQCDYPHLQAHIAEHHSFSQHLFELRRTYLDHDISAELIRLLKDWLRQHVVSTDMGYVPYINRRHGHDAGRGAIVENAA